MKTYPLWPEQWAVQASVAADRIEHRLAISTSGAVSPAQVQAKTAIEDHLAVVRDACTRTGRIGQRGSRDRWRGTSVERAYLNLHSAKIFMVDVVPDFDLDAVVPDVTTRLAMSLDRNDPRRVDLERMLHTARGHARRSALRQAMETAYDASDEEYIRLRDFRNIIILAAAAITILTALLVGAVVRYPDAIPLCFEPGVTVATVTGQQTAQPSGEPVQSVCPSGDRQRPTSGDVLIVAGLGALGGALGALVAIRNLRGSSTPYSVSTALAVLKVPSGALCTMIGMLLLSGGFVPGLTNLDDQRQILAYALIFGIAQQLVTRVADNRAQQILNKLPSKDPQAKQAPPPSVAPAPQPGPDDSTDIGTGHAMTPEPGEARQPGPADPDLIDQPGPPAGETPDDGEPVPDPDDATSLTTPPDNIDDDGHLLVQAEDEYFSAAEVEDLTNETYPLDPEAADEMPDDDGEPDVDDGEAAQTGTDTRG
jgi:hypothetical protein